jgi:cardiolipin synthase C
MNPPPHNQTLKDTHWFHELDFKTKIAQGLTTYFPLNEAFLSIASRRHIITSSQSRIDLQYYIWENDIIGQLLLADLLHAADRGVKIRLLIDDQNGTKLDKTLKQLALHPNFQIKIFNPYKFRKFRILDYIFRFKHVNHRMHNKLIIGDEQLAVTGGRNISREYFDASEDFQFTDLDILFFGAAAQEANHLFQTFWEDSLSVPTSKLLGVGTQDELRQLRNSYELSELRRTQHQKQIDDAEKYLHKLIKTQPTYWVDAHFVGDSPNKIRGTASQDELISEQFFKLMGQPESQMELVSAYFVPKARGLNFFKDLIQNNIKIRVLTNSFLANDVPVVHAFYQKYRKELLASGVKLYEFKPYIQRKKRTWYEVITGNVIPAKGKNASRLHAKFFDLDGAVFIGSFNFDPRSAHLNTEVGLIVKSESLQHEISETLDLHLPTVAYELILDQQGEIIWLDHQEDGSTIQHHQEPHTTKFQRFMIKLIATFPIEWMM